MKLFNYEAIDNQEKGGIKYGNSHCGSLLPKYCVDTGFKVISYGASDWVIPSGKAIRYTKNKRNIMDFFVESFYKIFKSADSKTRKKFSVSKNDIENWYNLRKKQLLNKNLYYSCMQKDILCANL